MKRPAIQPSKINYWGSQLRLVDDRDEVQATSVTKASGTVFQVTAAPTGVGKVIGKVGQTAMPVRTLLSAIGMATKRRYRLEIVTRRLEHPSSHASHWQEVNVGSCIRQTQILKDRVGGALPPWPNLPSECCALAWPILQRPVIPRAC